MRNPENDGMAIPFQGCRSGRILVDFPHPLRFFHQVEVPGREGRKNR
jgi:hypothetical protein